MKNYYKHPVIVRKILCSDSCGPLVADLFSDGLEHCKNSGLLSKSAVLYINPRVHSLGLHCLILTIEDEKFLNETEQEQIFNILSKALLASDRYKIIESADATPEELPISNWFNILLNGMAMLCITVLSLIVPPSLPLTLGMIALSFGTSAYTAREYLSPFFKNFSYKNLNSMGSAVALGWLLSLTHTCYHAVLMPVAIGFSMVFMSFIMPLLLITLVNALNEIKRSVLHHSQNMELRGMKMLFPQMAEEYITYFLEEAEQLTAEEHKALLNKAGIELPALEERPCTEVEADSASAVSKLLTTVGSKQGISTSTDILRPGIIIQVPRGACFPADSIILPRSMDFPGSTLIDESLMTGESEARKSFLKEVPSGALNLGPPVYAYVIRSPYYSAATRILFPANREPESQKLEQEEAKSNFTYLYTGLIIIGLIASAFAPLAFGFWSVSIVLQNITGILFGICPCTLLIAHQLPVLMSKYHRGQQGVILRDDALLDQLEPIHTIIFDKTGTLTTGMSELDSESWGELSADIQQRVFLLEKAGDPEHPVAKAICKAYGNCGPYHIADVQDAVPDVDNRGITGLVQNRVLHIGNEAYFSSYGIDVLQTDPDKIRRGFSPVYVAEDRMCKGIIYINHGIRPRVVDDLHRLARAGVHIVMVTGDTEESALSFNERCGFPFASDNIYFAQTPQRKETIIARLAENKPEGVWSIVDGLNDVVGSTTLREKGGVTASITSEARASCFSDVSLQGSLAYLFMHLKLNQFLQKNILQNQALLLYGALAFLACILSCSIVGIAAAPIVSLLSMCSTTLSVLFNSYRVKLNTDLAFGHSTSWAQELFASDLSLGLLSGANILFMSALFISTLATGGWSLPFFVFTAGASTAISSLCLIASILSLSAFASLAVASWLEEEEVSSEDEAAEEELPGARESSESEPNGCDTFGLRFLFSSRAEKGEVDEVGCFSIGFRR